MATPPTILQNDKRDPIYQDRSKVGIERILECAVVLNWMELTHADETTSIQVEYRTRTDRSVESLQIWASTMLGYWNSVCEYRTGSGTQQNGTTFTDGYYAADLPWMFDAILRHQDEFAPPPTEFLEGLIQINPPTQVESAAAMKDITEAMDGIGVPPTPRKSEQ